MKIENDEITIVSNVWESCSDTPEEAMVKQMKAQMMIVIRELIISNGWNQKAASENLGITQPRISYLTNGQISKFSIDNLYKLLFKCGYKFEISMGDEGEPVGFLEHVNNAA